MFSFSRLNDQIKKVLDKDIFFIGSVAKSGSTWVQHILNGHPEISCHGESHFPVLLLFLNQLANSYNKHVHVANQKILQENRISRLNPDDLRYLLTASIALILGKMPDASHFKCIGEKTPENLRIMEEIALMIPNAKFINIIRDGRDATVSGWIQENRKYPDKNLLLEDYVKGNAEIWAAAIRFARELGKKYPERYHEVRYEDLKSEPDTAIKRLVQFLNVDYSEKSVALCRQNGSFEKLSGGRAPGEEERSSHFRKGITGDWKNHFNNNCIDIFMSYGGELLKELGYE